MHFVTVGVLYQLVCTQCQCMNVVAVGAQNHTLYLRCVKPCTSSRWACQTMHVAMLKAMAGVLSLKLTLTLCAYCPLSERCALPQRNPLRGWLCKLLMLSQELMSGSFDPADIDLHPILNKFLLHNFVQSNIVMRDTLLKTGIEPVTLRLRD
jgi:hypothetical protein